jgi:Cytochrome oxidase complex assembly protein 1
MLSLKKGLIGSGVALVVGFAAYLFYGQISPEYDAARAYVSSSQALHRRLGSLSKVTLQPFSLETDSNDRQGVASLSLTVRGEKGEGTVRVRLSKGESGWTVVDAIYAVPGSNGEKI